MRNYSKEFEMIVKAYEKSGGNVSNLLRKDIASIIINGDKVIGLNNVQGVRLEPQKIENGVSVNIEIKGYIKNPIHICTGYVGKEGYQKVIFNITVEENSSVNFISHCSFPWSEDFTHEAEMYVHVKPGGRMEYRDEHFHSESGKINLKSKVKAVVEKGGYFADFFKLTRTRIGKMDLFMEISLDEDAVGHLDSTVKASKDDRVSIKEVLNLNGSRSRGIAKTTVVALDKARVVVINEAYGNAEGTKGHIVCEEITKGEGVIVNASPILEVRNEKAELTHEASIGRVNQKQLETLMAKGLSEEEATNLIIKGIVE